MTLLPIEELFRTFFFFENDAVGKEQTRLALLLLYERLRACASGRFFVIVSYGKDNNTVRKKKKLKRPKCPCKKNSEWRIIHQEMSVRVNRTE